MAGEEVSGYPMIDRLVIERLYHLETTVRINEA